MAYMIIELVSLLIFYLKFKLFKINYVEFDLFVDKLVNVHVFLCRHFGFLSCNISNTKPEKVCLIYWLIFRKHVHLYRKD